MCLKDKLQKFHIQIGRALFGQLQVQNAFENFQKGHLDPRYTTNPPFLLPSFALIRHCVFVQRGAGFLPGTAAGVLLVHAARARQRVPQRAARRSGARFQLCG